MKISLSYDGEPELVVESISEREKNISESTFQDDSASHVKNRKTPIDFFKKSYGLLHKYWVFSLVVLLPTFLAIVYLFFIASPQYVSETHFLVRGKSAAGSSMSGLSSLLESAHGGSQDTYAVQDYMLSRDAVRLLIEKVDLRRVFSPPYADFLAKFPSIITRRDFESFYKYYCNHVKAQIDEETGISHLSVRSFSARDSQYIAKVLLDYAEKLVNEMNDRQRYNTLHAAQLELDNTFKELHDTEMELASYRYANAIVDPLKQAAPLVGTVVSLETSLSMLEAEKEQLGRIVPKSPLADVYSQRIASLKVQIERAHDHITGRKEGFLTERKEDSFSLVSKFSAYDEIMTRRTIIEKKLVAETSALEMAKAQADKQMLYVTVVATPNLPDYAVYPENIIFIMITFFTALGIYITGALLVAGAREHALQ